MTTLIATVHGTGEGFEKAGVVLAAGLAAAVVLGAGRVSARARALAALAVLALTPVLLVADIWDTSQLHHLRRHPAEAAGAIVLGLLVLAALVAAMRRWRQALPVLAVLALPFRLPISTGGTTSNLLIPLYLVVGAGTIVWALPHLLARGAGEQAGAEAAPDDPPPRLMEWLLLGFVVLYGLQVCYSSDFTKGLENLVFFYIPFALLFALLRRVRWDAQLLRMCFAAAVSLAVVFSGLGFIEYATKHLLLNPKVVQANEYDNYFRVNSLFFDPSIYGRFLALVMIALTTVLMWTRRESLVWLGGVVLLWLMGGMVTSFSQSSVAALLLGLAVIASVRWDIYATLATCLALLAVSAAFVAVAPSSLHLGSFSSSKSANNATSGRYSLVKNGLKLFGDRPLYGYGPGSFSREYIAHTRSSAERATSASHTIPITVAAEQGLVGLLAYVALLVACFARLFRGVRPMIPSPRRLARLAIAACFAALVLHTFTYADFLEDPMTWTLLGVGAALAAEAAVPREPSAEQAAAPGAEPVTV
jgi:O-antigen ligase